MARSLKNHIISIFELNGFSMRKDACDFLTETMIDFSKGEQENWLEKIIDYIQKQPLSLPVIEKELIESAILENCRNNANEVANTFSVISAFHVPHFNFDVTRKKFLPCLGNNTTRLFAEPAAKGTLYKFRYTILYQRTLRNKLFTGNSQDVNSVKLRTIDSLLSVNSKIDNVVILGLLSQLKDDKYFLEDPSGIVELDLTQTVYHDGLFAECCFVLAEGWYLDKVLHVNAIGLPPREEADVSRIYFGTVNTFGGDSDTSVRCDKKLLALEKRRQDSLFVIISDVWLDQPKVLDKLGALFQGYSIYAPTAFILMGNFLSSQKGSKHFSCLKDGFRSLGELVSLYPNISTKSKFVIVPGPYDSPAANILPRPELSSILISELKSHVKEVSLATNPCRIQYYTQEIVVIRENLVTKLCRNSIHYPDSKDIASHFAKTIINQAHLVPLSLNICPLYWGYDAALQLNPCPDMVIVGEQQKPFSVSYNNCHVVNPGSFSKGEYTFKVYYPATREVEDCQIPDEL